jgi:hypothetical protein
MSAPDNICSTNTHVRMHQRGCLSARALCVCARTRVRVRVRVRLRVSVRPAGRVCLQVETWILKTVLTPVLPRNISSFRVSSCFVVLENAHHQTSFPLGYIS